MTPEQLTPQPLSESLGANPSNDALQPSVATAQFSFLKGIDDVVAPKEGAAFHWGHAAAKVRENLNDAMNARHVAFLLGSGCSSFLSANRQLGIPTMTPLAQEFTERVGNKPTDLFPTEGERGVLGKRLGLNISDDEYRNNLERLMEALHSFDYAIRRTTNKQLMAATATVGSVIQKITRFILDRSTRGPFSEGDETVLSLYQSFYRKLIYRDRALPRPWIFTTNYDLFNETALDRLAIPYFNGFSGTVERRFNPATFRYSLAEQLDIASKKWTAVDNFVYLCKLHGSISWIEENRGLFPIREVHPDSAENLGRVMIYPTPAKQSTSLGSPYADLFREFHSRVIREQSVLFILGVAKA